MEAVAVERRIDLWSCEQTIICRDEELDLRAVIAIDHTGLGPGLGGIRMKAYPTEAAGIVECQRLAAAMSRKNALAGLPYGGAKSVIFAPDRPIDRAALMRRFGDFVARTGGAYIPGVDMGTTTEDLAAVATSGADVSCSNVDPDRWTALGVWAAIRAAVHHHDGRPDLDGVHVVVQGAGHVGRALARELTRSGALVSVCDIDEERARAVAAEDDRVTAISAADALAAACDVLAPCAAAGVLDAESIDALRCRIVAGAANDTLAGEDADRLLHARGIVYVPDYVANAGGVIQIHAERSAWDEDRLVARVLEIGDRVEEILAEADATAVTPLEAAEARAAAILQGSR